MNQTLLKTKHSCALSVAKKLFFFAAMLISVATTAQPRTLVKSVGVNYTTKQVTINISWAAGSRGTYSEKIYNSKVWVFVDYQPVAGLIKGAWSRATVDLSALPTNCTADGTNAKGFWYQGQETAAQNAKITVTLTNVPAQFNWCAYATDYPPNATLSNGSYTLKGSPPFIINGTATVSAKTYTGDITTITDATACPGLILSTMPPSSSSWTKCSGFSAVSNVSSEGYTYMNMSQAESVCSDKGMRMPTLTELLCLCADKASLPGGWDWAYYWTSTFNYRNNPVQVGMNDCHTSEHTPAGNGRVKCVK